ncbi:cysteine--tRNA ligase [Mesorhizobium sp. A556]
MSEGSKGLRLYNTLTRSKEDFVPIDGQNVRMYVCGPTVYDFAHIGNARPVIVFDVLFRLLKHLAKAGVWDEGKGQTQVTYVRNITDVDDKINARALRDFGPEISSGKLSLNEAIRLVTEKTADQFHKDVAALGCLAPTFEPRATEHIDGMTKIIQALLDKDHAYIAQGDEGREALFDVRKMEDYGQLSQRNLEDQQAGARVQVSDYKRNPGDFVLWKESTDTEPGWDAVFEISDKNRGDLKLNSNSISIRGRPGWHIECSAMSAAYLGEVFDIHGGGLDLIFPHHENEIAQSRCAHGTHAMANVWMHNGFLQVEGRKMSKSEGNFYSINELLETDTFGGRKWPGEVLRLAMLMTHYREPIDFSVNRLNQAYGNAMALANITKNNAPEDGKIIPEVLDALMDDLNTSAAISALMRGGPTSDVAATAYFLGLSADGDVAAARALAAAQRSGRRSAIREAYDEHVLRPAAESVGLTLEFINNLKDQRLSFIAAKNWAEADRIRDELLVQGIQLKDGKDPATGERITTWEVKR